MKYLLPIFAYFLANTANADLTTVAVASNFVPVFEKISRHFESESSHKVRLVAGSSGKLYAQIVRGAPFDLFLSADSSKPRELIAANRAQPASLVTYAVGELVLWTSHKIAAQWKHFSAVDVIRHSKNQRIAIANPALAPYGLAAQQVLQNLGVYEQLSATLIVGENVSQVFHFLHSKNADLGFIAKSQIKASASKHQGRYWPIGNNLHTAIHQDMVLLGQQQSAAAVALHSYLQTEEVRSMITQAGYRRFDS